MDAVQRVRGDHRTYPIRGWLLGGWAALIVLVLAVSAANPVPGEDDVWPWAIGLMAFPVAATLVLIRRPGNTVGRVLGAVGAAATVIFPLSWYAWAFPDGLLAAHAEALTTVASVGLFGALLLLIHLFPTGRPIGRRHAWLVRVVVVWWGVFATAALIKPGPMTPSGRLNPFGVGGPFASAIAEFAVVGLPVFALAGFGALILRRRGADPVARAQLKWFFLGTAGVVVMLLVIAVAPERSSPLRELGTGLLVILGFWSLPAAIVVAITRHGLFEIDRIVSRTVTYAIVAVSVAALYGGSVVVLQSLLPSGSSAAGVAASTLAAAAAFRPLRRRVQSTLDRRFNRSRYEAEQVAQQFALRLRGEEAVELQAVAADLRDVVATTLQPSRVHLWLGGVGTQR